MADYDVVVVGARVAGSPTAMLLAHKGYRVLLVDKATFPSDTMSTLWIQPFGIERLARWGLLDSVAASGCPPIRRAVWRIEDIEISGTAWTPRPIDPSVAPRRTVLDTILIEAAAAAGAEVREGFAVDELLRDGDAVTGIRGRDVKTKTSADVTARVVVGADGMRSFVARAVDADFLYHEPGLLCWYYSFYSGIPVGDEASVSLMSRRAAAMIATNDDLTLVAVGWPVEEFKRVRSRIEGEFLAALDPMPVLGERVRQGKREERFVGTGDAPFFRRRSHGDGWALVGDASYHKDPNTAQGITDAFRDAEALAEAIDEGLSERTPLDRALDRYQASRDELVQSMCEFTRRTAQLKPASARIRVLLEAIARQPEHADRYIGVNAGTVPAEEFFDPENVARIVSGQPPATGGDAP